MATPLAPTLLTPAANTTVDLAAGYTFTWQHNSRVGGAQTAYLFRRSPSINVNEWWNATTGAWQSTSVWNTSSSQSLAFPAGKWSDGHTVYNWTVSTQDSGGQGTAAQPRTVTGVLPTSVAVTAPTGTVHTVQPQVSWTDTLDTNVSQTGWRIVIESGAFGSTPGSGTQIYDSGLVTIPGSASSATPGIDLANASYRWFVQIRTGDGTFPAWAHTDATVSVTPPATPTLTATADASNGRINLALTNNDVNTTSTGTIEYSDDGGTTWATVRGADFMDLFGIVSGGTFTVSDYEYTPKVARQYRGRVYEQTGSLITNSNYGTAGPVDISPTTWRITDPVARTSVEVSVYAQTFDQVVDKKTGVFLILGRDKPVVVSDGGDGSTFELMLQAKTKVDDTTAVAIAKSTATQLIQSPYGEHWYVVVTAYKRSQEPTPINSTDAFRGITLTCTEVDAP
jgi:hypothetical protein